MTIEERKEEILARIEEIKLGGSNEEKADMKAMLDYLRMNKEEINHEKDNYR